MKIENIEPTITNEAAYAQGFYYILLIQTELDGPFMPISNFYIGDAVVKFATPEDAEANVHEVRYGVEIYRYRIVKVILEDMKKEENVKLINEHKRIIGMFETAQHSLNLNASSI